MEPKKNPKADLNNYRGLFFVVGLTVSMFITWRLLELKSYDKGTDQVLATMSVIDQVEEEIPITKTIQTAPPPPPPAAPDVIEVVEDEEEIEETIIESTESSQNMQIEDAVVSIDDVEVGEMEEEIEVPFAVIENAPVFPGCENMPNELAKKQCFNEKIQEHVKKNLQYPETALDMGIRGRVSVVFAIDSHGNVVDLKKRGPDRLLEDEAARIIQKLPKMKPGMQRGRPVKVQYAIPINFVLQ